MENPRTDDSEDISSSANDVSPYFQRPQSAMPITKRKERSEEVGGNQSRHQRNLSKKKCYVCAERKNKCVGTYPFIEKCGHCKRYNRRCYPEEEGKRELEFQPAEKKCYNCRLQTRRCDGIYPFTQACGICQAQRRICTAEKPERGLPKDKKCQRCATNRRQCLGEPPFKNKCVHCKAHQRRCYPQSTVVRTAEKGLPKDKKCYRCAQDQRKCIGDPPFKDRCRRCRTKRTKCYAQGTEVPESIPEQDMCVGCKTPSRWWMKCDGKKPCTPCVRLKRACNYKDGNVKWTYQPDPEKWKEPTGPTCNECVSWNQSHLGKTLPCDGELPCNCCVEELGTMKKSSNCTYRYENGVSKLIKLYGERARTLRKRAESQRDRHRNERRERLRRERARLPQSDATAVDEDLLEAFLPLDAGDKKISQSHKGSDSSQEDSDSTSDTRSSSDHDGSDSDAGGQSDKEQSNQDHGCDRDLRSGFFDHENSKSYNNPIQKRAIGRDLKPPNDQNERSELESGLLEDPPNQAQAQGPDSQGHGDGIGHRHADERGSKKRKISRIRSVGGVRESFGRRRL